MKSVIVAGGGWAGLSCAVHLAKAGYRVTVLEGSKRLGGRASSFQDEKTGTLLDNGQHLFMRCYTETLKFLEEIGTGSMLKFQKNLTVQFCDKNGNVSSLSCLNLPAPLHLFSGLLRLKTLSLKEKLGMARVHRAVSKWTGNGELSRITVTEWLKALGQSERSRKSFWDLITVAALNESAQVAEAGSLAVVLKEAFFGSAENSQIAVSSVGLSRLLDPACREYVAARGGEVKNDRLVTEFNMAEGQVTGITLRDGSKLAADFYVSALPFFLLKRVLSPALAESPFFAKVNNLESSPIFSISLWFDKPVMDAEFCALLDTHVQWVFNKTRIFSLKEPGTCLSLVISGARTYLGMSDEELLRMCVKDIHQCFPRSQNARLLHHLIQREKNGTLSPKVGYAQFRLPQKTPIKNFFLCGDWTETGYPATIESAVLSGVLAARAISGSP